MDIVVHCEPNTEPERVAASGWGSRLRTAATGLLRWLQLPVMSVMDCSGMVNLTLQELRSCLEGLQPADVPAALEPHAGVTLDPKIHCTWRSAAAAAGPILILNSRLVLNRCWGDFHLNNC